MLTSILGGAAFGFAAIAAFLFHRLSDAGLELHELRCELENAKTQFRCELENARTRINAQMDAISDRNRVNNEQSERIARLLEMQNDAIRKIKEAHVALDNVKAELDPPF